MRGWLSLGSNPPSRSWMANMLGQREWGGGEALGREGYIHFFLEYICRGFLERGLRDLKEQAIVMWNTTIRAPSYIALPARVYTSSFSYMSLGTCICTSHQGCPNWFSMFLLHWMAFFELRTLAYLCIPRGCLNRAASRPRKSSRQDIAIFCCFPSRAW